jgi:hypothetical protein
MTTKVITSLIAGIGIGVAGWAVLPAHAETPGAVTGSPVVDAPVVDKDQGYLPFGGAPINYRSEQLDDPIARLQDRLDRGDVQLKYDGKHGYLKSVLDLLHVSTTSQTLVFSKTSFQYPQISPEHPRALYFNDDVYVGQVHDGKSLEFVSFDPMQGAIFYVLDEHQVEHPRFERAELDCIQCHVGTSTQKVPGVMLRSVYPSSSGTQAGGTPSYITGHESPIQERWGGWYVTGTHGKQTHMGNAFLAADAPIQQLDRVTHANKTSLKGSLDTSQYLADTSDIVAHLVLAHQTQMHNFITQANYQTRLALYADAKKLEAGTLAAGDTSDAAKQQIRKAVEPLVRYILFANEAPLEDAIAGTAGYAEQFAALGPRDQRGRSLRDFDLQKRIFRYPCSYLIYTEAFDSLPRAAKDLVFSRMFDILTGHDQSPEYSSLSSADRRAILEILVDTKPSVPEQWKQFVRTSSPNPQ